MGVFFLKLRAMPQKVTMFEDDKTGGMGRQGGRALGPDPPI